MPKGRVAPRPLICRACNSEFVTDRIGRQAWYCGQPKCERRRARLRREQDAEYRAACRETEKLALGGDARVLARAVAGRMRRAFVGYPAVVEAVKGLSAAEGFSAKADAARSVAVEALALESMLRRNARLAESERDAVAA